MATPNPRARITTLGKKAHAAQTKRDEAFATLSEAVVEGVEQHDISQSEAARLADVDRQTVRNWLGK